MAIANSDGSIILKTKVDTSEIKQGTRNLRSEAAKLAAEYRKAGLSQSEAMKKAWSEIERNTKETKETTKATKKFGEQAQKTGKQVKSSMSNISGVIKGVATKLIALVGVYELINFGKQAVELASNLEEVQNVVDVAFGNMAYKMEEFSKTAIKTFGISELTAKRTASTYMAMAKGMGIADDVAADMALTLTGLTADISSFYNVSQEMADTAIKSIFTGETESLKQYGIVMTEVNLEQFALSRGITKSISAMSQQEKTMLRYNFVLEQTALAQGDFVRTQDSWANQTRILQERWKQFQTTIGRVFIAIGSLVLPLVNTMLDALSKLGNAVVSASNAIYKAFTGKQLVASSTGSMSGVGEDFETASGGVSDFGDSVEKAGKQVNKSLAGFDELNTIGKDISGGSAGLTNAGSFGIDGQTFDVIDTKEEGVIDGVTEKMQSFANVLKEWAENIDFTKLKEGVEGLVKPIKELAKVSWNKIKWGVKNVIAPLVKFTIEEALPTFLNTLANAIDILRIALDKGQEIFETFYDEFLEPIASYTADIFIDFWEDLNKELEDFKEKMEDSEVWEDFKIVLSAILKALRPIATLLVGVVSTISGFQMSAAWYALEAILTQIADVIGLISALLQGDVVDALGHLKDIAIDNRVERISEALNKLKEKIKSIVDAIDEFVKEWKPKIKDWWEEDVAPWFTKERWASLANKAKNGLVNFFTGEDGFVQTWKRKIYAWWKNDVSPWFTKEKWKNLGKKIKDGLVEGVRGAVNGISGVLNNIINGFQKMINGVVAGINKIINGYNKIASLVGFSKIGSVSKVDLSGYKIPMLAQGAVLPPNRPFLAMLGDQKSGTNIEAPLDTIVEAVKIALGGSGGFNGRVEVPIYLDSRQIAVAIRDAENNLGTQTVTGGFANVY